MDRVGAVRLARVLAILRRNWLVFAGMTFAVVEAVRKGADTYFDFLNIKWVMGWLLANGDFNLKGIATTRKWGPPYLDIWNAVIATIGAWWIPAVIHGLVHALIVPSIFLLARRISPSLPSIYHQAAGVVAVAVPLVFMQVGTSTGHLYSALPLIWSLNLLLRARTQGSAAPHGFLDPGGPSRRGVGTRDSDPWRAIFAAGAVLALSPLVKPSALALVPAHLVGVVLIMGSLTGVVAFILGFLACYFLGAIGWATVVAMVTEGSPLSVQSPGLPISGPSLFVLACLVVASGALWWLIPSLRPRLPGWLDEAPALTMLGFLSTLSVSWFFTGYLRETAADYRWFVFDYEQLADRLFHAGDLQFGFQTLDLESAYFDTSIPLAMVLLGGAVALVPMLWIRETLSAWGPRVGLVWFVSYPFLYNLWATGYTRYASQVVPLVGVAGLALFGLHRRRVVLVGGATLVLAALMLPHLLVNRVSAEIPRFGQIAYDEPIYQDFVSDEEVELLNALIPSDSTVLAIGTLNTYLIPQLGRDDLEWWFWKPRRHEVAVMSGDIMVMFSPGDSDRLPEYAEQGLLYDDCSVLRFRRTSIGLCIGSVDPAVRSEALEST
jgi:hypothetical protein